MRYTWVYCVPVIIVLTHCNTINYCGSRMCGYTDTHTFCQYQEGLSKNCVGYTSILLSTDDKIRIIARLNKRRSDAASGLLRNFPTAGDMLKLRWVDDLAREAQLWADQCIPPKAPLPEERDQCRDLYSITVGQCVASVVGEAPGLRVESFVDMWYMQNVFYKSNVSSYVPLVFVTLEKVKAAAAGRKILVVRIKRYTKVLYRPDLNRNSYYGDFAQIVWSRSYMVGCGRSRFMAAWHGKLMPVERLVCNFGPKGPSPGFSLWTISPPATTCPPRSNPDPTLKSLCNFQNDKKSANNEMLLDENELIVDLVLQHDNDPFVDVDLDEEYLNRISKTVETSNLTNDYAESLVDLQNDNLEIPAENFTNSTINDASRYPRNNLEKYGYAGRPKPYIIDDLNIESVNAEEAKNYEDTNENSEHLKSGLEAYYEVDGKPKPSDSEIVTANEEYADKIQDLHEALRQMEEILASSDTNWDKGYRKFGNNNLAEEDHMDKKTTPKDKSYDFNKTLSSNTVLRMILRHMPYVKQYEDKLLGPAINNGTSCVSSYILLIYLPCLLCLTVYLNELT